MHRSVGSGTQVPAVSTPVKSPIRLQSRNLVHTHCRHSMVATTQVTCINLTLIWFQFTVPIFQWAAAHFRDPVQTWGFQTWLSLDWMSNASARLIPGVEVNTNFDVNVGAGVQVWVQAQVHACKCGIAISESISTRLWLKTCQQNLVQGHVEMQTWISDFKVASQNKVQLQIPHLDSSSSLYSYMQSPFLICIH